MANAAMTINERRKYLLKRQPRYLAADRVGRGVFLTEMLAVTGLHRKSLTRLLRAPTLARQPHRQRRRRTYDLEVRAVVATVWESLDSICAERLTPALRPMARYLAQFGELALTEEVAEKLARVSRATVQRLVGALARPTPRLPQRGPERANDARQGVPMGRLTWQISEPGHVEVALVQHSGPSTAGE